jgi:hypothetical protein
MYQESPWRKTILVQIISKMLHIKGAVWIIASEKTTYRQKPWLGLVLSSAHFMRSGVKMYFSSASQKIGEIRMLKPIAISLEMTATDYNSGLYGAIAESIKLKKVIPIPHSLS